MNKQKYLEQVYNGILGMCAGIRLGAPVESTIWTYERIRATYGNIRGYVKNYSNFAADDDVNGPQDDDDRNHVDEYNIPENEANNGIRKEHCIPVLQWLT